MRLTTKGKFAVTALLDVAIHGVNNPVSLQDVAQRQHISVSYLEQLFVKLRRLDLVKSYKGPGGGYSLARLPRDICVAEIIRAVDDVLDARACRGLKNCKENQQCLTHDLWEQLTRHVYEYLDKISLQDLVDNNQTKAKTISPIVQITFMRA